MVVWGRHVDCAVRMVELEVEKARAVCVQCACRARAVCEQLHVALHRECEDFSHILHQYMICQYIVGT